MSTVAPGEQEKSDKPVKPKKPKNFSSASGDKVRDDHRRSGMIKTLIAAALGGAAYGSRGLAEKFLPKETRIALDATEREYQRLQTSRALSGNDKTTDDIIQTYATQASRLAASPVAGMKGHELIKLLRTRLPIRDKWHPHTSDAHYEAFARGPAYGAAQILDETAENIGRFFGHDKRLQNYMNKKFHGKFSEKLNQTAAAHGAGPMDVGPSLRESLAYRGEAMSPDKQKGVMHDIVSGHLFNKDRLPVVGGFSDHYKKVKDTTANELMTNSFKNYTNVGHKARGVYNVLNASLPVLLGAAGVGLGGVGIYKLIKSLQRTSYEKKMMRKAEREGMEWVEKEEEPAAEVEKKADMGWVNSQAEQDELNAKELEEARKDPGYVTKYEGTRRGTWPEVKHALRVLQGEQNKQASSIAKRVSLIPRKAITAADGLIGYRLQAKMPQTLKTLGTSRIAGLSTDVSTTGIPSHHVSSSQVPGVFRGMGLGRKMYGAAIRDAFQEYKKGGPQWFLSDLSGRTSEDAAKVWHALRRRGYPVVSYRDLPKQLDTANFGIDLAKMRSFYGDGAKAAQLSQQAVTMEKEASLTSILAKVINGARSIKRVTGAAKLPTKVVGVTDNIQKLVDAARDAAEPAAERPSISPDMKLKKEANLMTIDACLRRAYNETHTHPTDQQVKAANKLTKMMASGKLGAESLKKLEVLTGGATVLNDNWVKWLKGRKQGDAASPLLSRFRKSMASGSRGGLLPAHLAMSAPDGSAWTRTRTLMKQKNPDILEGGWPSTRTMKKMVPDWSGQRPNLEKPLSLGEENARMLTSVHGFLPSAARRTTAHEMVMNRADLRKRMRTAWGKDYEGGVVYPKHQFNLTDNTVSSLTGTPEMRHELGHWKSIGDAINNPARVNTRAMTSLRRLAAVDPTFAANASSMFPLETTGHTYAALGNSPGAKRIRAATADYSAIPKDGLEGVGFESVDKFKDWTQKFTDRFPKNPEVRSLAEHLTRNYGVPIT